MNRFLFNGWQRALLNLLLILTIAVILPSSYYVSHVQPRVQALDEDPSFDPGGFTPGIWERTNLAGELPQINGIAMDGSPLAPETSVVIATNRGVYISDNGGSNWSDGNQGLPSLDVQRIINASNIFYASIGKVVYSRARDGEQWEGFCDGLPDCSEPTPTIHPTYLAANAAGTLVMANGHSVYQRSTGGGAWVDISRNLPATVAVMGLHVDDTSIYVGATIANAADDVYTVPIDGNSDWSALVSSVASGQPKPPLDTNGVSDIATGMDKTLYIGLEHGGGGVWRRTFANGTYNWQSLNLTSSNVIDIDVVPSTVGTVTSDQIFAATTTNIFQSSNINIGSWNSIAQPSEVVRSFALSPTAFANANTPADGVLFVGTTAGLFRSTALGLSLSPFNEGLSTSLDVNKLVFADSETLFATSGLRVYRSTNAGATWNRNERCDIGALMASANYSFDGTVFLSSDCSAYNDGIYNTLNISTNRGSAWETQSISMSAQLLLSSPAIQSDNTIYAASYGQIAAASPYYEGVLQGLFNPNERSVSWKYINTGLIGLDLLALAITPSPNSTPYLLAGTAQGIWSFNPVSGIWNSFNGGDITATTAIRGIIFSPNYARDGVLIALGGNELYRYQAIDSTWRRIVTTGLPATGVRQLAISPDFSADRILFAATDDGVYLSRDEGSSWEAINTGLTTLSILSIAVSPEFAIDRTLFIGTVGKGVFRYTLPPAAPAWLVLLYMGGDDNAGSVSLSESMKLLIERLRKMQRNPDMRLVVFYDGADMGDVRLYLRDPETDGLETLQRPSWVPANGEMDSGSISTLQAFIRWARTTFPGSKHSMLSIIAHGGGWAPDFGTPPQPRTTDVVQAGGWRGMSIDAGGSGNGSSLSTKDTGDALTNLGALGLFDVIFFDACLMGMIESAYQIRANTTYFIAGQNLLWANLRYETYLSPQQLTKNTSPETLATNIVESYHPPLPRDQPTTRQPYTIAAIDLRKMDDLRDRTNAFAQALLDYRGSEAVKLVITQAYADVQKFDYDASLSIDTTDGYVDLAHFALLISQKIGTVTTLDEQIKQTIKGAADAIYDQLKSEGANQLVIRRKHLNSDNPAQGTGPWNFDNAYGLSIYLPLGEQDCRPTGLPGIGGRNELACTATGPENDLNSGLAVERQLFYYTAPEQLAFTQNSTELSAWAAFLLAFESQTPSRQIARNGYKPFRSPLQLRTEWHVFLPQSAFGTPLLTQAPTWLSRLLS